jgi:hypothetical protein
MRVVSRVLVAAAIAVLPGVVGAQSVGTAGGVFQAQEVPSATIQYVAPDRGQPQTVEVAAVPAADPARVSDDNGDGADADRLSRVAGPSLMAATAGIRANTAKEDLTAQEAAQRAAHHGGLGPGGALMIVGAAAFIAGLIIGGTAGTAVAIAGAAVGLYGLFLFLQ